MPKWNFKLIKKRKINNIVVFKKRKMFLNTSLLTFEKRRKKKSLRKPDKKPIDMR